MDFLNQPSEYSKLSNETETDDDALGPRSPFHRPWLSEVVHEFWRNYQLVVVKSVLVLALMLASAALGAFWSRSFPHKHIPVAPPTVVPDVPYVLESFKHDEVFGVEPTRDGGMLNETWDALLPPGRGFVLIRDYQKYELTPGLPTGDGYSRFSISMFHQLHCLDYVRKTIYEIILKVQEGRREEIDISELDQVDHLPHCIDYIRQGIMCAGDTTMEGAVYDRHRTVVFGMGNPHLCRDFRAIYEFTKDNFETIF